MKLDCQCKAPEGQNHRDGCDGVVRYERTGLVVRTTDGKRLDLDSFELAAAKTSDAAYQLRIMAMRLKRAAEMRENACRDHQAALREFMKARDEYGIATSHLSFADQGNVLAELKALPLPEECK